MEDANGVFDREYNAQEFTDYFATLVTTGVMKGAGNQLVVSVDGSSMMSKLSTGIAFLEGRYYANDSVLNLTHDTEVVGKSRIDRVVIRLDLSTEARHVKSFVKKGVASASPVAPVLTQTPNVYEISVAQVKLIGGQTYIASNNVTSERGTNIICPWAGSRILPNFDNDELANLVGKVNNELVDASTTRKGVVKLNDTVSSTSTNEASTPNALKTVNDKLINMNVLLGQGASAVGDAFGQRVAIGAGATTGAFATVALGTNAIALNINEGVLGGSSSDFSTTKWKIPGSLSVSGTKNFEIPHPHPDKKHTHVIRHGAVESPTTGDTLYRYTVEAREDGQVVELQLPDYFEHLNANVDVWVNPHLHFGRAFGVVEGDILKVTCEKIGLYKVLIIGTRNDDNVQDWYVKGVEREIGESWLGETNVFEVEELTEVTEFEEVMQ
ncbi:tail fiber protein [Viridibacillus sp. YIM B01967]|uniref:Tail fiber protein n=1 Tax=Viridibacillus soli TaxID=2798301 RepID=A0ABS1H7E2_9BACL|nr:phage tail protein [Viridibacillus soli]MBK3495326.1 tail fiber protein [Viridibacillus soli]